MSRIPKVSGNPASAGCLRPRQPQQDVRRVKTALPSTRTSRKLNCAETELSIVSKSISPKSGSSKKTPAVVPIPPPSILRKQMSLKTDYVASHPSIIPKNLRKVQENLQSGNAIRIGEEMQKLNPRCPAPKGSVKEIVTILNEKDVTGSYETTKRNYIEEIKKKLKAISEVNHSEISTLIKEENEDIQNILKLVLPKLANESPKNYPLKKRLQALISNPENMATLAKSIVNPKPKADEVISEPRPEFLAAIVKHLELGGSPVAIFNSLFRTEGKLHPLMFTSSATPGPISDILVPLEIPQDLLDSMRSIETENAAMSMQRASEKPTLDSFSIQKPSTARKKRRRKLEYMPLTEELPPWGWNEANQVIEAVGSYPRSRIFPCKLEYLAGLERRQLRREFLKGIEYLVDTEPIQYVSNVQLRGSQPPVWFPGYMVALSDTQIRIAKSPSEVLLSAWKSVQPVNFSEHSILYN